MKYRTKILRTAACYSIIIKVLHVFGVSISYLVCCGGDLWKKMVFDAFNTMKVIPIFVMAQRDTLLWPFSRVNVLKYLSSIYLTIASISQTTPNAHLTTRDHQLNTWTWYHSRKSSYHRLCNEILSVDTTYPKITIHQTHNPQHETTNWRPKHALIVESHHIIVYAMRYYLWIQHIQR